VGPTFAKSPTVCRSVGKSSRSCPPGLAFPSASQPTTTKLYPPLHHFAEPGPASRAVRVVKEPSTKPSIKMSYNKDNEKGGEAPKVHRIRITLTSRKVASLEKVCTELIERAKSKDLRVKV
jgi:hypothetical protein